MNKKAFTVGSLIPGMIMPSLQTIQVNKPQSTTAISDNTVKTQVPNIILFQNGNRVEVVPAKGKLLDVALGQGKPIQYKCRKGTCGQCTVKVIQGPRLSEPNNLEHKKLQSEIKNGYRLACQAEIS